MSNGCVYILLLNWNGWADTVECIESLLRSDYPNFRVIICDNGSEDGSIDQIKAWASGRIESPIADDSMLSFSRPAVSKPIKFIEYNRFEAESGGDPEKDAKLIIIKNCENLGFSAGNNVGLRYAISRGADYIWLLNNDTIVTDSKIIGELVQKCGEKAICSTVTLDYYSDAIWYSGGKIPWAVAGPVHYVNRREEAIYDTDFVSGCNLFASTKTFADMGLLDERFFVGMEDCELCWKAKRNGYQLRVINKDAVRHKIGKTNRFSRFAIVNSYLCKSFWTRKTSPVLLRFVWLLFFIAANLIAKHSFRFLISKLKGKKSELGFIEFWNLALRSLIRGFGIKTVSQDEIRSVLGQK